MELRSQSKVGGPLRPVAAPPLVGICGCASSCLDPESGPDGGAPGWRETSAPGREQAVARELQRMARGRVPTPSDIVHNLGAHWRGQ